MNNEEEQWALVLRLRGATTPLVLPCSEDTPEKTAWNFLSGAFLHRKDGQVVAPDFCEPPAIIDFNEVQVAWVSPLSAFL